MNEPKKSKMGRNPFEKKQQERSESKFEPYKVKPKTIKVKPSRKRVDFKLEALNSFCETAKVFSEDPQVKKLISNFNQKTILNVSKKTASIVGQKAINILQSKIKKNNPFKKKGAK